MYILDYIHFNNSIDETMKQICDCHTQKWDFDLAESAMILKGAMREIASVYIC